MRGFSPSSSRGTPLRLSALEDTAEEPEGVDMDNILHELRRLSSSHTNGQSQSLQGAQNSPTGLQNTRSKSEQMDKMHLIPKLGMQWPATVTGSAKAQNTHAYVSARQRSPDHRRGEIDDIPYVGTTFYQPCTDKQLTLPAQLERQLEEPHVSWGSDLTHLTILPPPSPPLVPRVH